MSKSLIYILAALFTCLTISSSLASEPTISLYGDPNGKHVIQQLPINSRLVPFYWKGDWVKVGNAQNGQVGWINQTQYQKAKSLMFHPLVQSVFVDMKQVDGKPGEGIVVYKNGKKLTGKEAQAIYKKIRAEQEKQLKQFRQWQQNMNKMFNDPSWFQGMWPAPVIIINSPEPQKKKP